MSIFTNVLTPAQDAERRNYKRWRVNIAMRELQPEVHVHRVANVSAGGFFCANAPPRHPGQELLVELELRNGHPLVTTVAVVRNTREGVAVRFTEPQSELAMTLQTLYEKNVLD